MMEHPVSVSQTFVSMSILYKLPLLPVLSYCSANNYKSHPLLLELHYVCVSEIIPLRFKSKQPALLDQLNYRCMGDGYPRLPKVTHGYPRLPMVTHGYIWFTYGYPRLPMGNLTYG